MISARQRDKVALQEYTHTPMYQEVELLCGSYYKVQEATIPFQGREVLYFVGGTTTIESCCGTTCGLQYIMVPGFVVSWQSQRNAQGLPVSQVEPVGDPQAQGQLRDLLRQKHKVTNIDFW